MKYGRYTIKGDTLDKKAGIIDGKEYMLKGRPVITYYNRLVEYEDLEEQGFIVRLPCKVGDTIYRRLSKFGFDNWTVEKINIYIATYGIDYSVYAKSVDGCGYDTFYNDNLNEDWFITRVEAEKKLKELKGEEYIRNG